MADEPIVNINMEMPSEGGPDGSQQDASGSVTVPNFSLALGYIARSVDAVSRNVATLVGVAQAIAANVAKMSASPGTAGAATGGGGAPAPKPAAGAAPAVIPPPPRPRGVAPPPIPKPPPPTVPFWQQMRAVVPNLLRARTIGALASSVAPVAALAVPFGVAAAAWKTVQAARASALGSLRESAMFSPQIAGFQAQVDTARFMAKYRAANTPWSIGTSRFFASSEIAAAPAWEGTSRFIGGLGEIFAGIANYSLATSWIGRVAAAIAGGKGGTLGSANRMMTDSINQITGGLIEMTESPIPGPNGRGMPTKVRWRERGGWERSRL